MSVSVTAGDTHCYSWPIASRFLQSRRKREHDIVDATRALFDERGLQDAPMDEIARAVGINKAQIYRHFSSKEELFVLTVTRYLDELREELDAELAEVREPVARLERSIDGYAGFCLRYPAFLDCALSLMRRPAAELQDSVSDAVWLRLGQAMGALLGGLSRTIAAGASDGTFAAADPDFAANHIYAQTLGTMHLARSGVGVRKNEPGVAEMFALDPQAVRRAAVQGALATVIREVEETTP
jgi:AcrR family transcriptional regulator